MSGSLAFRARNVSDGFDCGFREIPIDIDMNTLLGDSILVLAIN
jgi:hypothetical protein